MPMRQGRPAGPLASQCLNESLKHAKGHDTRNRTGAPVPNAVLHAQTGDALLNGPLDGLICLGQMPRALRQGHGVEITQSTHLRTHPCALEARIDVGRIMQRLNTGCGNDFGKLVPAPTEQRAQQLAFGNSGQRRSRTHGRETTQAGAAR